MNFVDTHSHLYAEEFDDDRDLAVQRALDAGVDYLVLPDIDSQSRERMFDMKEQYPELCSMMVGLHPTSVNDNDDWQAELAAVEQLLSDNTSRFCGVGEIGLDLYWSRDFEQRQVDVFEAQIRLALKYDKPIDVHVRDAWALAQEVVDGYRGQGLRGVMHAYSGEFKDVRAIKECGEFMFGIGGVVTFKRSSVAEVVAQMSLSDILLETDAPYLTPVPHRGKRNESSYIPLIANVVANLQGVDIERVARVTTENAHRMFVKS